MRLLDPKVSPGLIVVSPQASLFTSEASQVRIQRTFHARSLSHSHTTTLIEDHLASRYLPLIPLTRVVRFHDGRPGRCALRPRLDHRPWAGI